MKRFFCVPLLFTSLVTGCTIIPGLNVHDVSGSDDETVVKISDTEEDHLLKKSDGALVGLKVITLTPEALLTQVKADNQLELDQERQIPAQSVLNSPSYRIGAGDILNVTVWEHPELTNPNGEFRDAASSGRLVSADGSFFYPYVGLLSVAGLTPDDVRVKITEELRKVIAKPQVDVRIVSFRSQRVQVSGEVKQPGVIALDDMPKGILDVLDERGGVTDIASRRTVVLNRGGQSYQISLQSLLAGGSLANSLMLMPGDIVHVPDRTFDEVFVLGEVNKEGPVYLQRRTTLIEALANATGLDKTSANGTGILVFRRPSAKDRMATVYRVDLSNAVGLLTAGEFELQPRDVVYVSPTAFAKYNAIVNQLLPTITSIFQLDLIRANNP